MNIKDVDLNAPAFGAGAQKVESLGETVVEPVAEPKEEEKEVVVPEEESKVPYSRFKKFHDRALEAEALAEEWRQKAETFKPKEEPTTDSIPGYWIKLYGDSDASKEAWVVQKQENERAKEEMRREALEAVRNERLQETQQTEQNVEALDSNFEELSALVGRDLTDKEQSAVLDIVDDYTPKDKDGNFAGSLLSFDKAWGIYEMQQQVSKAPKAQARDTVAALTGAKTQGEAAITEQDKNFNPLDWNAWRKRI